MDETAGLSTSSRGTSVLGSLATRREKVIEQDYTDLRVPRWTEPEIYVRFKVVPHSIIRKALQQQEKARQDKVAKAELASNIEILVHGCIGVYALLDGDDTKYSLRLGDERGNWTRFDDDLAANLECGESASEVVRALYLSDGDIMSAASAVVEFSGYRDAEADERIAGE
jgi:hypothetical protein